MLIKLKISFLTLFLCFGFIFVNGQSREDFKSKRKKIQQNIKFTNDLLAETSETAKKSLNRLKLINKRIYNREVLLNTLNSEVRFINRSIDNKSDSIKLLKKELSGLTKEYEKMILYAAKNMKTYDKMIFIFSADDFNQAYKRLVYLQQYVSFRKKQVELITNSREKLKQQKSELLETKTEKQQLLNLRQKENSQLIKERLQQTNILKHLNSEIGTIKQKLEKEKRISGDLEKSVSKTIDQINNELARSKRTAISNNSDYHTTREYKGTNFAKYKGKLNWPTEHGVVLSYFGEHPHSFLKGIKVVNNGIDISTTKGAYAKAVFKGTVSKIVTIPGANKAILLCHGKYFTLYGNLETIDVSVGDEVSVNQKLGKIFTDKSDNDITLLQFQIWHLNHKLNPIRWLSRK